MKKTLWALVAFLALGAASAPGAHADGVVGKVLYLFDWGSTIYGYNGGVMGRRPDNTYWLVYLTPATSDLTTTRLLNAAIASSINPSPQSLFEIFYINPYSPYSNYLYVTTNTTGYLLYNW